MTTPSVHNHDDDDLEDYAFEHGQLPPELRAMSRSPQHQGYEELNFDHPRRQDHIRRASWYYREVKNGQG